MRAVELLGVNVKVKYVDGYSRSRIAIQIE